MADLTPSQAIKQIDKILTPAVTAKFKPAQRVELVRLVALSVFEGPDSETAQLIREAMAPYQEDHA